MRGAIIGDIMGSPYEFCGNKEYFFPPLYDRRCFTDDTVMTLAVAKALMVSEGKDDEATKKALIRCMKEFGRRHRDAGYGGMMGFWLDSDSDEPYGSWGNGSAMRVSSAGWLYEDLETTRHKARLTAEVTHNTEEGIRGAEAVAVGIYLARTGRSKKVIREALGEFYNLDRTVDEIRADYKFDASCEGSVPEAIICFLESRDFEDAVRDAISLGGDADTLGCMAGSIAEAYYGVNGWAEYEEYLTDDLKAVIREFDKKKYFRREPWIRR